MRFHIQASWIPDLSSGLRGIAVLIGLGVPALLTQTLYRQHEQEIANAEQRAANTARALSQHAERTFETIDTYLRAVVALTGPRVSLEPEVVHAALRDQFARSHGLNNIIIIDRNGSAIVEAVAFPARALDVRDRDYFQILRDHPESGIVVGKPIVGRSSGRLFVPVARRIDGPDGTFAGVVQAFVDPATFRSVYDAIDNGPGAAVSLWRADGTLLVRAPWAPEMIGHNYASGPNYRLHVPVRDDRPFWSPATTDGIERVFAFGFLEGYPIYVSAAVSRNDALAAWRRSALIQACVAGGLALVLIVALIRLARELGKRRISDARSRASEAHYRLLAENTSDIIILSDRCTTRRYVSPSVRNVLGYEPEELVGTRPLDFVHPEDASDYQGVLADLTAGRIDHIVTTQRHRSKEGAWVWLEVSFKLTRDPSGEPTGYVAALRDVTERRLAEENLRLSEERLALALDSGSDGLWDWDLATGAVELSSHWFGMLGYAAGEIEAHIRTWNSLVHPDDAERSRRLLAEHVKGLTQTYACEYRLRRKTGEYAWTLARGKVVARDALGFATRIVGTHIDITARKEAERQIEHMAAHDALTGLSNRLLFRDRLTQEIANARRQGGSLAVLACDLDRFKNVNDTYGHSRGDDLLRAVADRLRVVTKETDTVARLGGDEFAIILSRLDGPHSASRAAERVIEAVGRPFDLNGCLASIGVSVGIALGPRDDADADSLFRNADTALYRAKASGRNAYSFYEPGMDAAVAERTRLEHDLRTAVRDGGFTVYYQPIVRLNENALGGFEALLRWPHPERGTISPAEFIPLAEATGLIVPLGEWVLREVCREASGWSSNLRVAVNVSAVQFKRPGLEQAVVRALASSGLESHRLELEITESVLMEDSESSIACLHRLRALGVRVALDDFGTGFSSLSYLRRFPFDKLKIDRAFIRDIADPNAAAIVRAVVGIGTQLGMSIVAEGVETAEQVELVRQEGCTEIQGFFFGRPMPAAEAISFAHKWDARAAA